MDAWIILLQLAILGGLVLVYRRQSPRTLQLKGPTAPRTGPAREHLGAAAHKLNLSGDPDGVVSPICGQYQGLELRVEPMGVLYNEGSRAKYDLKVILRDPEGLDGELGLSDATIAADSMPVTTLILGDPVFEQAYTLSGPERVVRARLGQAQRATLLNLPGRLTVLGDSLTYITSGLFVGAHAIEAAVDQAYEALLQVRAPKDPVASLVKIAVGDPEAQLRAGALNVLLKHHPAEPSVAKACALAIADGSAQVRLLAARGCPDDAQPILREIINGPHPETLRCEALHAVRECLGAAEAGPLLYEALTGPSVPIACEAAAQIAHVQPPSGGEHLLERLKRAGPRLSVAILRALGELAAPPSEPALIKACASTSSEVRQAAAGALGAFASPGALAAMQEILQKETTPAVRKRLTWAIGQIRARHQPEAGRLSVAPTSLQGSLAVAPQATSAPDCPMASPTPDRDNHGP